MFLVVVQLIKSNSYVTQPKLMATTSTNKYAGSRAVGRSKSVTDNRRSAVAKGHKG